MPGIQTQTPRNPTELLSDQVQLLSSINQSITRLDQRQAETSAALADLAASVRLSADQRAALTDQAKPLELESISSPAVHVVNAIVIIGFAFLTLFWVAVGVWQIYLGVQLAPYSDVVGIQTEIIVGALNIFLSLINIAIINSIVKRGRGTVLGIWIIALLSAVWGMYQMNQGVLIQAVAVPIYIVSAMLITINRNYFPSWLSFGKPAKATKKSATGT
jgi:hypothetical protein